MSCWIKRIQKQAPRIALSAMLGAGSMYILGVAPHFIEVEISSEGSRIEIDSRPINQCDLAKAR